MIRFVCLSCNATLTFPDKSAGKRGRCPQCEEPLVVPPPVRDPETYSAPAFTLVEPDRPQRRSLVPLLAIAGGLVVALALAFFGVVIATQWPRERSTAGPSGVESRSPFAVANPTAVPGESSGGGPAKRPATKTSLPTEQPAGVPPAHKGDPRTETDARNVRVGQRITIKGPYLGTGGIDAQDALDMLDGKDVPNPTVSIDVRWDRISVVCLFARSNLPAEIADGAAVTVTGKVRLLELPGVLVLEDCRLANWPLKKDRP